MMGDRLDVAQAREALHAIDPSCDRDTWHRIGTAARAAGLSIDDIDEWSRTASNYGGARDVRSAFRTVNPDGGITERTLFAEARAAGWRPAASSPPNGKKAPRDPEPSNRAGKPRQQAPGGARGGKAPADVLARCKPAPPDHGYIVRKGGTSAGLFDPSSAAPFHIAGRDVRGWLVVPSIPIGRSRDEPASLQFIPPAPGDPKLNLPGHAMRGAFTVGEVLAPDGLAFVVEGIGQAWACWKATGSAAVACFGAGRMREVASALHELHPALRLVLVADRGKEAEAEAIAREVLGRFVTMPDNWPANADVNDLAQRDGTDALEALLAAPHAPAHRYRLLGSSDLRALPPLQWAAPGLLPARGVGAIVGPSGSGKTFLLLAALAALAEGAPWFGHRVNQTPAVYLGLEGTAGIRQRVSAWEMDQRRPLPDNLRLVLKQGFRLTDPQDVADLAAAVRTGVGPGAVVAVDTLNAAAPEADENASADMGRIIEGAKQLQALADGLVLLVHHTGKDATKGLRGHSSLFAALDVVLEVTRNEGMREWKVAKLKDGEEGAAHPFRLEPVEIGEDDEGEPVTSAVVRQLSTEDTPAANRPQLPKGGNQRIIMAAIGEMLAKSPDFGKGGAPAHRPCVDRATAIEATRGRLAVEPGRHYERANKAVTELINRGVFGLAEGWLWLR